MSYIIDNLKLEKAIKALDIGVMRKDGYVTLIGRKKDMIRRGGECIFPAEVELFLTEIPGVSSAQVFAVSDKRLGEVVAAFVRKVHGSDWTQEGLIKFCEGKISYFKIPKYIRFVDEFPFTPLGKVKKYEMREMLEKELRDAVQSSRLPSST